MPDRVDREYLQINIPNFDEREYERLRDDQGGVDKNLLIAVHTTGTEKEVYLLWRAFTPLNDMGVNEYLNMLHDSKILGKGFNRKSAEVLFHSSCSRTGHHRVNYNFFRTELIPEIARQKSIAVLELLHKISQCEGPVSDPTGDGKTMLSVGESLLFATAAASGKHSLITQDHQLNLPAMIAEEAVTQKVKTLNRLELEATLEQVRAAENIQKATRAKISRRRVQQMREVLVW